MLSDALSTIPEVSQGIVVTQPHQKYGKILHAFVVLRKSFSDLKTPIEEIKGHLSRVLPEYMLPASVRVLPEFPYTSTGKVDRNLLTTIL